jgi:hypothetical protein
MELISKENAVNLLQEVPTPELVKPLLVSDDSSPNAGFSPDRFSD